MSRDQSKYLGGCDKRRIKVEDAQCCDYFEAKRKNKHKVACRYCKHFAPIKLDQGPPVDSEV
jgi:hypothetical protein